MRKALLGVLTFALVIIFAVVLGGAYLRRDNTHRVKRAQEVMQEIEQLEIGKSDHTVADAIAAKFGIAPPPYWLKGRYNKENCAAPNHTERCTYTISMNDSPVVALFVKYQSLARLGVPSWWGIAQIGVTSGTVDRYSFLVWDKTSNGHWRVFGADMSPALPRFDRAQAQMSDSYSVRQKDLVQIISFALNYRNESSRKSHLPVISFHRWPTGRFATECFSMKL